MVRLHTYWLYPDANLTHLHRPGGGTVDARGLNPLEPNTARVGSKPTPGTKKARSISAGFPDKGRRTRAGGWGRGEEPNPGPTESRGQIFLSAKTDILDLWINPVAGVYPLLPTLQLSYTDAGSSSPSATAISANDISGIFRARNNAPTTMAAATNRPIRRAISWPSP